MKKKIYLIVAFLAILNSQTFAQGWIGDGGNILYARNASLGLTPIYVGIGTNLPTAQFHTTGTVRFAGLTNSNSQTRVLVSDANGNLYYRDVSTIGATNAWLTIGNSAGSSDFIGTTNSQNFRIRTNNTQRMVVTNNGLVGVGTSSPSAVFEVNGTIRINPAGIDYPYANSLVITQNTAYNHGGDIKFFNLSTNHAWDIIQGGVCGISGEALNFLFYPTDTTQCTNAITVMTLAHDSVGIRTANPTANFHVNGSVRFQNLPTGSGTALVIDANGYVHKSLSSLRETEANDSTQDEIDKLKEEIEDLKKVINQLQLKVNSKDFNSDKAALFQNYPNPYKNATIISYYLPSNVKNAKLLIFDNTGKEISNATLKGRGKQNLTIQNNSLTAGVYYYSLIADGKKIATKKMVLIN